MRKQARKTCGLRRVTRMTGKFYHSAEKGLKNIQKERDSQTTEESVEHPRKSRSAQKIIKNGKIGHSLDSPSEAEQKYLSITNSTLEIHGSEMHQLIPIQTPF